MRRLDAHKLRSLGPTLHARLEALVRDYVRQGVLALEHQGRVVRLSVEVEESQAKVAGRTGVLEARFSTLPSGRTASSPGPPGPPVRFQIVCRLKIMYIEYIRSVPSHNVPSGSFALDMVMAFARAAGCKTARLEDASFLTCPNSQERVSLRRILLLSRGVGWYEARGFRSDLHWIRPGWQEKAVTRAMAIPVAELRAYFGRVLEAVRAALAAGGRSTGKLQVHSTWVQSDYKFEPSATPLSAALELMTRAEAVLTACSGSRCKTLGSLVRQISRDCLAVEALTDALMPAERIHILKTDHRGRAVPVPRWLTSILDLLTVEAFTEMVIDL